MTPIARHRDLSLAARGALLLATLAAFGLASTDFQRLHNVFALLQSGALLGLVAVGLAMTMLAGEFDLSVGSMVTVSGIVTLKLADLGAPTAVAIAVGFGLIVGTANAAVTAWLRVSSLVVTVGMMMALSGFASWLADGKAVTIDNYVPSEILDDPVGSVFSVRSLITLGVFLAIALIIRFTRIGRDMIATGSLRSAAEAGGVRVKSSLLAAFVVSAGCAALAGSLLSLSLATATPTMGSNLLLQAASAAILGGVSLSGGVGRPMGVLIGALILATVNNGLGVLGIGTAGILFANGALLLLVVLVEGPVARNCLLSLRAGLAAHSIRSQIEEEQRT